MTTSHNSGFDEEIIIRMLKSVNFSTANLVFHKTVLFQGQEYEAFANNSGALFVVCDHGQVVGVKRGEFAFVKAPKWVRIFHEKVEKEGEINESNG